jgi:hypothetical protein
MRLRWAQWRSPMLPCSKAFRLGYAPRGGDGTSDGGRGATYLRLAV